MDASSSDRSRYDAFLSFRGEDTRKGFTDHLYRALEGAGIHTFRDDDEIERGAEIKAELQKAIKESRVSIIVFSKDYASSTWCLDELTMIMKRRTTDGHMVLPVFYHVDPSHVRKQTGSFAEAFCRHEERFKEKMEEWRKALKDVADLGGMVLGDRYEGQFIQDIVEEVGNKLDQDHKALYIAPYVVGMNYRVKDINKWLNDGSNNVGLAVICGMGGIGKTTIAKAAYNQNYHRFEGSSFLADINRETSGKPSDLIRMQRQLLSDIQKGKSTEIYSTDEGMRKIECAVYGRRLLIVVDDVDHSDQFNVILRMREWLHQGSKIVITTRSGHLLNPSETCEMFNVQGLSNCESLELFSWHAFRKAHPIEGYMDISESVVQHCGGLPLALQVLGSSLSGKGADVWEDQLKKLEVIPHGEIHKVLRISYDSLDDDHDKELFLHIACFFIGKKRDYTITVLENLGFNTISGIQNLVDRSLVKINLNNKLVMHQLLRNMGRGIICGESLDPGKRSRVWHHKEASNVLRKTTGTKTIKGFMLNLPMLMEDEVDFKTEAFRMMRNLEILLLNNVKISGSYEDFPKNLIWWSWQGFHSKSVPANFYLENLVGLELQNSFLEHVWKGTRFLPSLKILNLSHSHGLITTSDLSGLPRLERLVLKDCINLVEVDESIGNLKKLVFLNLKGCKNLMELPRSINMLESLRKITLAGCAKLNFQANMDSDTNKVRLQLLLPSFPFAGLPHSLGSLNLEYCNLLEIPSYICSLSSLKSLNLRGNPILGLPESVRDLIMLQTLVLENCRNLATIPDLPSSLERLWASCCTSLKRVGNLTKAILETSPYLISGPSRFGFWLCNRLVEVESRFNIKPLRSIDIKMIKDIGLFNLESTGNTDEVDMYNHLTNTITKGPVQGVYDCGIFSIFLHGHEIPEWYMYRSNGYSVLSITVPNSHLNLKVRGLNACVVFSCPKRVFFSWGRQLLKVSNDSKGVMWTYAPIARAFPKENKYMLWLSHWQFGDDELEGGDKLRVSLMNNLFTYEIKEFGIQFVYEHENQSEDIAIQPQTPYWRQNLSLSDSKYQFGPDRYLLCNHSYIVHPYSESQLF